MQVILFRHGIAMEPAEAGDAGLGERERPLTEEGVEKTRDAVAGLCRAVERLDLILYSPLVRAQQTAKILSAAYPSAKCEETRHLAPGSAPETLAQLISRQRDAETVALVGHEPDLSGWAAWALTGSTHTLFGLKKAGACLIEFSGNPQAKAGELLWLLTAGQLRRMG